MGILHDWIHTHPIGSGTKVWPGVKNNECVYIAAEKLHKLPQRGKKEHSRGGSSKTKVDILEGGGPKLCCDSRPAQRQLLPIPFPIL